MHRFAKHIKNLTRDVDLEDLENDDGWGDDLTHELYPPPKNMHPVFVLDLIMDTDGPRYTQPLNRFPKIATSIFSYAVSCLSEMPQILPMLMPQIQTTTQSFLGSVQESEAEIRSLKIKLGRYVKRGAAPADCFGRKFHKYNHIWNMDIDEYVQ